jgi:hypothetical protein
LNGFRISEKEHEEWYGDTKLAKEMKEEQLERETHCSLKFLDLSDALSININDFKLKELKKQLKPNWPPLVYFLAQTKLEALRFKNC